MRLKCVVHSARNFLLIWICATVANPTPMSAGSAPPPNMPERVLKAHGIPITRNAVIAALASNDPQIRDAASAVVIRRWPKDAIGPVERAMLHESLIWNKIRMASDLFALSDPLGRDTLVKVCHDLTVTGSARMETADVLVRRFEDDSCLDSVFNTLKSTTDPRDTAAKEHALELAPELIHHFGTQRYQSILQLVIRALRDPWPGIRTTASTILAQIGDPATLPNLESAIAEERNDDTRLRMTRSLHDLRSKIQIPEQSR